MVKFQENSDVLAHYDLLTQLGVFEYVDELKGRIRDQEALLSEVSELFNQSSPQDLIDYVISCIVDKFVPAYLAFVFIPHGADEDLQIICYNKMKPTEPLISIGSFAPYREFFNEYPSPISFSLFEYKIGTPGCVEELKPLNPEIIVPLLGPDGLYGMIIVGKKILGADYLSDEIVYIDRLMKFMSIGLQNNIHYRSAVTDHKTRIYNHSFFMRRLREELGRARRYGLPLAVLILDVDHFKRFNDQYGHLAGDKILYSLARVLERSVRDGDVVARFGGEEFVVMLSRICGENAFAAAERIRKSIEAMTVTYLEQELKVTVSVGGSALVVSDGIDPQGFVEQADKALYEAKRAGRNRTHFFGSGLLFRAGRLRGLQEACGPDIIV